MHTFTQYPLWVRVAAPLTSIALLGAFIHMSSAEEEVLSEQVVAGDTYVNPIDIQSFGYSVSGIVESANSVTVRALSNGTVREKFVGEGSVVRDGDALLRQEIPLMIERMMLQDAQNNLGTIMQDASVIGRSAEEERARIQSETASTSASLMTKSSMIGTESASSLLATQLYGSVTSLVATLDFIDANKSHFPGTSLTEFRKTVDALYGSGRTYLSGAVQYNFHSSKDIRTFLDGATKNTTYPNNETLIEIAILVDQELDATLRVLMSGEKDFLDAKIVPQYSDLYTAYLTYRGSVIESQADLRIALGGARGAGVGGDLQTLGARTEDTLSMLGYTTSSQIAENALKMAAQSDVVSSAVMNVLSGEESLGIPKAPFDGVIDEVFVKVGEFVSAGTPLMTIVGSGAKEMNVSVPYTMLPYLKEGAEFTVDGRVVGSVARFSQTAMNGNVMVVIELLNSDYIPGMTLRGEVQCGLETDGAIALLRSYVAFDTRGAYVLTEAGTRVPITILHDTGTVFVVKPAKPITEKIKKAISIDL